MEAIKNFFGETLPRWWSPQGLIETTPPETWVFRWVYVGLLAVLLVIAIVTLFLKIRPSLKARIQALCWTNIFLGAFLYFCRDQRIPILGMDILRFIQEVALIFWVNSIVIFARTKLQDELLMEKIVSRKSKYLPKPRSL
jgi:hypothetical protein